MKEGGRLGTIKPVRRFYPLILIFSVVRISL